MQRQIFSKAKGFQDLQPHCLYSFHQQYTVIIKKLIAVKEIRQNDWKESPEDKTYEAKNGNRAKGNFLKKLAGVEN